MVKNLKKVNVLEIDFLPTTNREFRQTLINDNVMHKSRFVVTANPEIVLAARADKHYADVISQADYVTADGIGIVIGAKILGHPLPERITGYDTMIALLKYADRTQKKVYLLGAKPEVLEKVKEQLAIQYPNIIIAGAHDGYFSADEEDSIAADIQQSQPDFIFVALGFPKQEYFIAKYKDKANAIWMGVGGSFDVLSGTVKRAPEFWQNHHIEWLYRLLKEPTRFKRMLALPRYLALVCRERIRRSSSAQK